MTKYIKISDKDFALVEKLYREYPEEFSYLKNPRDLAEEFFTRALIQTMDNLDVSSD
jgi:hypothetical protein